MIGILGGIGSGKSAVAAEFGKLGCAVIDADRVAHEMLDEPTVKKQIIETFGNSILDSNSRIDRAKLANLAFADADSIAKLNAIVHPPVLAEVERRIERFSADSEVKAIVLDMPLLAEIGWDKRCDTLIFIACDEEKRLKRAQEMGFAGPVQAEIRENFQISLDSKASIAENTIDNNSDFSALVGQVADVFPRIVNC